jgi:hypothetical protein
LCWLSLKMLRNVVVKTGESSPQLRHQAQVHSVLELQIECTIIHSDTGLYRFPAKKQRSPQGKQSPTCMLQEQLCDANSRGFGRVQSTANHLNSVLLDTASVDERHRVRFPQLPTQVELEKWFSSLHPTQLSCAAYDSAAFESYNPKTTDIQTSKL